MTPERLTSDESANARVLRVLELRVAAAKAAKAHAHSFRQPGEAHPRQENPNIALRAPLR